MPVYFYFDYGPTTESVIVYTMAMGMAMRWASVFISVAIASVVGVSIAVKIPTKCNRDMQALVHNAVSQDALYATATAKCLDGVHDWRYESTYAAAPSEIVSRYDIPTDARVHCARAHMTCDTPLEGPLGLLMPTAHTKTLHEVCVRGVHVYSIWTLSLPSVFDKMQLTHDLRLDLTEATLESSEVKGSILWPFSIFDKQIRDIVHDASIDAALFYMHQLCPSQ